MTQFQREKQPLSVNSITIKNKQGDVFLTDISQFPMFNKEGKFQGSIMVIDDISESQEVISELKQKNEDLERLQNKFRDVHTKLKLIEKDKHTITEDKIVKADTNDLQKKIADMTEILTSRNTELEKVNTLSLIHI